MVILYTFWDLIMSKEIRRNDPCTCGSGKKYKKCCGSPKLSSRNISIVKNGIGGLQERISGISKEGITQPPSSLSGRVITATNLPDLKID
jgi:SEC-C motif